MTKHFYIVARYLAIVLIAFAIILQLGRLLAPQVDIFRQNIAAFLSDTLQRPVAIDEIQAYWYGLSPHVVISRLGVTDPSTDTQLTVANIEFSVDLLSSILNGQWVWQDIYIADVSLQIVQEASGEWSVLSLPLNANNSSSWSLKNPLHLFDIMPQVHIDNITSELYFSNGAVIPITLPSIMIEDLGQNHRLSAAVEIAGEQVINVLMERQLHGAGPRLSSQAYIELTQFPVDTLLKAMPFSRNWPLFDNDYHAITLDAVFWFDLNDEKMMPFYGEIFSDQVALSTQVAESQLSNFFISSTVQGEISYQGDYAIGLKDLTLNQRPLVSQLLYESKNGNATAWLDQVKLTDSIEIILDVIGADESFNNIKNLLTTLSPKGELRNISVNVDTDDWQKSTISANVFDVSIAAYDNIPAVDEANGYIHSQWPSGYIMLSSPDFTLFPQQIYDQPINLGNVAGQIMWGLDPANNQIDIYSYRLSAESSFGEASGFFHINIPWQRNSRKSHLVLQVGLKNSGSEHYSQFVPNRVPEKLRQWIKSHLHNAVVPQAGFIYRGGFSGGDQLRSIQLFVDTDDAAIEYSQEWPLLEKVIGQLVINNRSVDGYIYQAETLDTPLRNINVKWPVNDQQEVNISFADNLALSSLMNFVNASWLSNKVGDVFDSWSTLGDVELNVDVNVPVFNRGANDVFNQRFSMNFLNNTIISNTSGLQVDNLSGKITFSQQNGFSSDRLEFDFLGDSVALDVSQLSKGDDEFLWLTGRGKADVNRLFERLLPDETIPVTGKANYDVGLRLLLNGNAQRYPAKLDIRSTLLGVGVKAPEPFLKKESEEKQLNITVTFDDIETRYSAFWGDSISAYVQTSPANTSGTLLVNRASLSKTSVPDNSFIIGADFERFDIESWLTFYKKYIRKKASVGKVKKPPASYSLIYDFRAKETVFNDRKLTNLQVSGKYASGLWEMAVKSPAILGRIDINTSTSIKTNKPINAVFEYIHLPRNDNAQDDVNGLTTDSLSDVDFSLFKEADIDIQRLSYGQHDLGRWQFTVNPIQSGVEFSHITLAFNDFKTALLADGSDGATLRWQRGQDALGNVNMRTELRGRLQGGGIETLLKYFGYSSPIESELTRIDMDVDWLGSPAAFSVKRLNGSVGFAMENGRFLQDSGSASTGLLRLLGLLNIDTWLRRLRLNFSDIYKKGVVYDQLNTSLVFDKGWIYFQEPLYVKAPSSDFTMAGRLYYPEETVDAILVTTLPASENLTFAAAVVGGVPTAIGIYLASKIFKRQVKKLSSLTYSVTGNWNNPQVTFVDLFDNSLESAKDQIIDSEANDTAIEEQ